MKYCYDDNKLMFEFLYGLTFFLALYLMKYFYGIQVPMYSIFN